MRTRAHTHIHTHRQTLAQMPHRRSPSHTRTLSLCCCQIKAWKAHKGGGSRRADFDAGLCFVYLQQAGQRISKSGELFQGARVPHTGPDNGQGGGRPGEGGRGVREPRQRVSVAGVFSRAIEYHTQDLAIAKEVGDRAGEGKAYGNLGDAYQSQGDFSKAIKYHGPPKQPRMVRTFLKVHTRPRLAYALRCRGY